MRQSEEQRWIAEATTDPNALQHLYNRYFPKLYAYIRYRVDRVQDAEDLTAETFLKVVEHIEQFAWQGEGSFAAWLFRIAHNCVANFYRRHNHSDESLAPEAFSKYQTVPYQPDDAVLQQEMFLQLHQLMRRLSTRRQEVIILRFFAGLRNQEIAQILALDERTVASHLYRGLVDLHKLYLEELEQEEERAS